MSDGTALTPDCSPVHQTDAELSRAEWIEERAGILEYDAGYQRADAEAMAEMLWDRRNVECHGLHLVGETWTDCPAHPMPERLA